MVAAEALQRGYGGVTLLARLTGMSRVTIHSGLAELRVELKCRTCAPSGGRKACQETQPDLMDALDALVDPETRGDPMLPLRWTSKSTRLLSEALAEQEFQASTGLVSKLLRALGYSLQANSKTREAVITLIEMPSFPTWPSRPRGQRSSGLPKTQRPTTPENFW